MDLECDLAASVGHVQFWEIPNEYFGFQFQTRKYRVHATIVLKAKNACLAMEILPNLLIPIHVTDNFTRCCAAYGQITDDFYVAIYVFLSACIG